ncbi:hypothetical protein ACIHAR_00880 [Streptomyces sp. NPDC052016]|uniref:hypothetical protein n=1 Tax=Streptomyces sp. NPDC052016 TaxID=3365680 RepID=UPI0037CE0925
MGDARCGWCGDPLPESAARGRRYCHPAHRQAAWRARRRWRAAAEARKEMVLVGAELLAHVRAAAQHTDDAPWRGKAAPGRHCTAVAHVPGLAGQLVHSAVLADRRAGASWAQIGAGLGISAEAARGRYGRTRGSPPGACEGR